MRIHGERGDLELEATSDATNLRLYNRSGSNASGSYVLRLDETSLVATFVQFRHAEPRYNPYAVPIDRPCGQ